MPRIGTERPQDPADVRAVGLGKRYSPTDPVAAMADVDLHVAAGEVVTVVGASGCGKSTLLRIVAGFETATSGEVTVAGEQVNGPGPDRGVVFQDYGLFPWLTVAENIAYGLRQKRYPRTVVTERTDRFLHAVGLERFARRYPGELSGGMQQRVAIARVLANGPAVMLMDEPFGALDALTRGALQRELVRIQQETGTTVMLVTHSIEEAVFLGDRVVVMAGGASHGVPGHVREVVPVPLGRDRDTTSPEFNAVERHVAGLVHAGAVAA